MSAITIESQPQVGGAGALSRRPTIVVLAILAVLGAWLTGKLATDTMDATSKAIDAESRILLSLLRFGDVTGLTMELDERQAEADRLTIAFIQDRPPIGSPVDAADARRLSELAIGTQAPMFLASGLALMRAVDVEAGLEKYKDNDSSVGDVRLYVGQMLLTPLTMTTLLGVVLGWASFGFAAWAFLRHERGYLRRLDEVNRHLLSVGEGRLKSMPIEGKPPIEIRDLMTHVNLMIVGMREWSSVLQSLAGAPAHELYTPLTKINLSLQDLETVSIPGRGDEIVAEMRKNLKDALALFAGLLSLARTGANLYDVSHFKKFDVSFLLHDLADDYESSLKANARELIIAADDPIHVMGECTLTRQLFVNLIENACKYAPPGATITLWTRIAEDGAFEAGVTNDRGGFPKDVREKAFQAWERSHEAEHARGYGLGLSLVRLIAVKHGWRASITPSNEIAEVWVRGRMADG